MENNNYMLHTDRKVNYQFFQMPFLVAFNHIWMTVTLALSPKTEKALQTTHKTSPEFNTFNNIQKKLIWAKLFSCSRSLHALKHSVVLNRIIIQTLCKTANVNKWDLHISIPVTCFLFCFVYSCCFSFRICYCNWSMFTSSLTNNFKLFNILQCYICVGHVRHVLL